MAFDKFAACFAPDEISRNPDKADLAISFRGSVEHSTPDRTEKVIMQAHTESIFLEALAIDSVTVSDNGGGG